MNSFSPVAGRLAKPKWLTSVAGTRPRHPPRALPEVEDEICAQERALRKFEAVRKTGDVGWILAPVLEVSALFILLGARAAGFTDETAALISLCALPLFWFQLGPRLTRRHLQFRLGRLSADRDALQRDLVLDQCRHLADEIDLYNEEVRQMTVLSGPVPYRDSPSTALSMRQDQLLAQIEALRRVLPSAFTCSSSISGSPQPSLSSNEWS